MTTIIPTPQPLDALIQDVDLNHPRPITITQPPARTVPHAELGYVQLILHSASHVTAIVTDGIVDGIPFQYADDFIRDEDILGTPSWIIMPPTPDPLDDEDAPAFRSIAIRHDEPLYEPVPDETQDTIEKLTIGVVANHLNTYRDDAALADTIRDARITDVLADDVLILEEALRRRRADLAHVRATISTTPHDSALTPQDR